MTRVDRWYDVTLPSFAQSDANLDLSLLLSAANHVLHHPTVRVPLQQ